METSNLGQTTGSQITQIKPNRRMSSLILKASSFDNVFMCH